MYLDLPSPAHNFIEPWHLPLKDRQEMLTRGRFRIAYFYEQPNNSSFRYRAFNMCEAINLNSCNSVLSACFFYLSDVDSFEWLAKTADMLVICRSRYSENLLRLVMLFQDLTKNVVFDADDLVFDPSYSLDLVKALGQDPSDNRSFDYWHAYSSRMRETALLCNSISATNAYLARIASQSLGIKANIISNTLNNGQILASQSIYRAKEKNSFLRNERFTIGYFSGSPSHKRDFQLVSHALKILLEQRESVDIIIAGYIELDESFSAYSKRISYEPFRDYISLQSLVARCEACIAPLAYSTFANCKSELKYFESAAVGTVCLATPTFTFKQAINHGVNGYLCRAHEWLSTLLHICDSPQEIVKVSNTAFNFVMDRYSHNSLFKQIISAYDLGPLLRS